MYGRHSLYRAYSLTVSGHHSSLPRLPQTGISSILRPLLSTHVHLYVLLAHPHFLACSRSMSGLKITSIAVHISATGLHATWASTSFQGCQTGSPHLCPAPVVIMIMDMIQCQNSEGVSVLPHSRKSELAGRTRKRKENRVRERTKH
jgi:hypothetical protein